MNENTLTTKEVAKELGVSVQTVQVWIKKGMFPNAYKLDPANPKNSPLRIPLADVYAVVNSRLAAATAASRGRGS
jgi:predicted DNA-binding transcriptional regulator AlpA